MFLFPIQREIPILSKKLPIKMEVYLSPKKDQMSVYTPKLINISYLIIVNVVGKTVLTQTVLENITYLNISDLEAGIYFVALVDNEEKVLEVKQFSKRGNKQWL